MTNLDLILKNMIFSAPHVYPTVWHCYMAIFVDERSQYLIKKDTIECPITISEQPVINDSYLSVYKDNVIDDVSELDYGMKVFLHDFIKEHIDIIVSSKSEYTDHLKPTLADLSFISDNSLVWLVDKTYSVDIVKAARSVLSELKGLLWYHHGLHYSDFRTTDPQAWNDIQNHSMYMKVCERLDFLSAKESKV